MSALRFNVVYEDAGEGWVYAHVSELPEVQTQGEDLKQARVMVLDAISMVLKERRARGEPIPAPGWAPVESVEVAARRSETSSANGARDLQAALDPDSAWALTMSELARSSH